MHGERRSQSADELIGRLATRQGGVIARQQVVALGIGQGAIDHRIAAGRLLVVPGHRGVLAVGHRARGPRTALWAAHLALGATSVVSHRSSAAEWELRRVPGRAELTLAGDRRARTAFRVHRTSWLPQWHVTTRDGLPITIVARTLLDLGAVVPPREVERAFDQAEVQGVLDLRAVERVLAEGVGRAGSATLRAVLGRTLGGSTLTDSELEEMLLTIVRDAGLPEPRQQHPLLGFRVDFCWPEAGLVVEADGAAAHAGRRAHARDTRRDVALTNAGWTVLRFAYADIVGNPGYVAEAIAAALARGRRSP